MPLPATIPGTLTNVTALIGAPMVDMAINSQLLDLFPLKKPALSAFLPATHDTPNSRQK